MLRGCIVCLSDCFAKVLTQTSKILNKPSIFIVDDDSAVRDSLDAYLSMKGMNVRTYDSAEALLNESAPLMAELLVLDVNLPGIDGFELLSELRSRSVLVPAILISGRFSPEFQQRAMEAGVVCLIEKPIDHRGLMAAIANGLGSV